MTSPPTTSRTAPGARYHTDPPLAVPVTAPSGVSSVATTARSPDWRVQAETPPPRRHPWTMVGSWGPGSPGLTDRPGFVDARHGRSVEGQAGRVRPVTGRCQQPGRARGRAEGDRVSSSWDESHLDSDLVGADHLPCPPSRIPGLGGARRNQSRCPKVGQVDIGWDVGVEPHRGDRPSSPDRGTCGLGYQRRGGAGRLGRGGRGTGVLGDCRRGTRGQKQPQTTTDAPTRRRIRSSSRPTVARLVGMRRPTGPPSSEITPGICDGTGLVSLRGDCRSIAASGP